ncbi:hypothetical protein AB0899_29650, partial [Streptomyces sp. NPDC007002]|uniref:hypothetical protein n=1 Tax=Streptomyces sp. NPDC007002 TaxID=3156910 RepID=UPI0034540B84
RVHDEAGGGERVHGGGGELDPGAVAGHGDDVRRTGCWRTPGQAWANSPQALTTALPGVVSSFSIRLVSCRVPL